MGGTLLTFSRRAATAVAVLVVAIATAGGIRLALDQVPVDPQGGRWVATATGAFGAQDAPSGEDSWRLLPDASLALLLDSDQARGKSVGSLDFDDATGTLTVRVSGDGSGDARYVVTPPIGHSCREVTRVVVEGAGDAQHLDDQLPETVEEIDPDMTVWQ